MNEILQEIEGFLKENHYLSPWIKATGLRPAQLEPPGERVVLAKEEVAYAQQQYTPCSYLVVSGRMRVFFVDAGGAESSVFIAQPGCLIGELSAIDGGVSDVSAAAVVDTVLLGVRNGDLLRLMAENPDMALAVMRGAVQKERVMFSRLEYSKKSSAARVYMNMLCLCAEYGVVTQDGVLIDLRVTHEELATLTGLNRVTVSKIHQRLKAAGIIAGVGGRVVLRRPRQLMRMALEE